MKNNKRWFTLVEIMVALTIFSIIMGSVMSIYIVSSETTYNSEISRAMQENVKNVYMEISEDVIKNWINWAFANLWEECKLKESDKEEKTSITQWFSFCTKENIYSIATKRTNWEWFDLVSNLSECDKKDSECFLVKKSSNSDESNQSLEFFPVTNSLVTVRNADFKVVNYNWVKKLTVLLKLQPSIKAWVRPSLVEKNIFNFQTTISERPN